MGSRASLVLVTVTSRTLCAGAVSSAILRAGGMSIQHECTRLGMPCFLSYCCIFYFSVYTGWD